MQMLFVSCVSSNIVVKNDDKSNFLKQGVSFPAKFCVLLFHCQAYHLDSLMPAFGTELPINQDQMFFSSGIGCKETPCEPKGTS